MPHPLDFDALTGILHRYTAQLPDYRKAGPKTRYAIHDAALGALGIFFTPSPSFWAYQRRLQPTHGNKNVQTLVGVAQIPGENQVRTLLDPLAPSRLEPVLLEVFARLEQHRMVAHFRRLDNQRLVALDGTHSFSSQAMPCRPCLTRQRPHGHTLSQHAAIPPVIICPGQSQVIALPPAYIMPQDGQTKQDGERAAGTRWLAKHAARMAPHGGTFLGDDLYSNQPFCTLVLPHGGHCLLTCKPDSHPKFSER